MDRRTFLSHSGRMLLAAGLAPRMFAENRMSESNQRRPLSFLNDWIESVLVTAVREMPVEDAIVVNLSSTAMHYRVGGDDGTILPWKHRRRGAGLGLVRQAQSSVSSRDSSLHFVAG